MIPRRASRWPSDLRWGLGWGLRLATIYCLVGGIMVLVAAPGEWRYLMQLIGTYLAAGALGGLMAAATRPLNNFFVGQLVMSILVYLPIGTCFMSFLGGPFWLWGHQQLYTIAACSIVLGPIFGHALTRKR